MAKRRTSNENDSDNEPEYEENLSKRARVDAQDEEREDADGQMVSKGQDALHKKTEGRIAEQGIIQSLEMHQFMCHPRLSFTFGPQINFIVGRNGSGKSAVLSAITIALGGKAITTGRGSGLKNFIREGQNAAEVTITIKNEGDDAYKPSVYGKSIVITRRFTKEGSSSYKIKSKDGKTISTKKDELSAICDHMNIQVDNPLNILSQDSARQFLNSSHPKEKYEFFLKGTQLKQLSDEYETILANIQGTYKILEAKRQVIPELRNAVREADNKYKAAQKALEAKEELHVINQELAWAYVKEKEKEMGEKVGRLARVTRRLPRHQEALDNANVELKEATAKITELENEREGLGDVNHLYAKDRDYTNSLRTNRQELQRLKSSLRTIDREYRDLKEDVRKTEESIEQETRKLQVDKQAEREERQREITAAKSLHEELQKQIREVNDNMREGSDCQKQLEADMRAIDATIQESKKEMLGCGQELRRLESERHSQVDIFGNEMQTVLERIGRSQWQGDKPIGPLGLYVTLVDPKWRSLLQSVLGNIMSAFAITDARDRNTLKKILADTNNMHMQIIVSEKDIFDYTQGEPPSNVTTILRVLRFENEYVKRILINQNRIERTLLAETRIQGERLAESLGGGTAMTADHMRVMVQSGGYYSVPIPQIRTGDPRSRFFPHGDRRQQIEQLKTKGREEDSKYSAAMARKNELEGRLAESRRESTQFKSKARELEASRFRASQRLKELEDEAQEDLPVNISALEQRRRESEENAENMLRQAEDATRRMAEVNAENHALLEEHTQIKTQTDKFTELKSAIDERIMRATDVLTEKESNVAHYSGRVRELEREIVTLEREAKLAQDEYTEWTQSADLLCQGRKFDTPRPRRDLERIQETTKQALDEQEKQNGASIEILEEAYEDAIRKYQNTTKEIKEIGTLSRALKSSINVRLGRWRDFRRHIALRTKMQFQLHLSKRGYFGKVFFNHEKERLELRVQNDDLAATQGLSKDPRSLSGGEKSFSTICLLLSLWEAIGCPIRCLDEFDVFMDSVNRRISMRMMIETANASDSKQYILITPQDLSKVNAYGDSVRIHRMSDPERGQGTLNFS